MRYNKHMQIPTILRTISGTLSSKGGRAIVVGGSVRDHFLGLPIKDYDIEVFGLPSMEKLEELLSEFGSVNLVGKSFGVLKLFIEGEEYDFSLPRVEEKTGRGHRGFTMRTDGKMAFEEAARRRDFTINAMGYDIEAKIFLDPFGGRRDMQAKVLRHIDAETFVEDPLRVYRAVQFAARFGYTLVTETEALCREMVENGSLEELPKERIYIEWKKLLLKAPKPSAGFELMRKLGILERYFPELYALVGVPQEPEYHPEGDVWVHTMMALDAMHGELKIKNAPERSDKCPWGKKLKMKEKQQLKLLFAVLCHDMGKAVNTTFEEDGKIRSLGHENTGIEETRRFLYRLTDEHDFIESILPLVEYHLKPSQFYKQGAKASAIRRLATKVSIEELVLVAKADFLGRTTEEAGSGVYEAGEWLLEKAKKLKVAQKPLECLVQGRDLIALGLEPSPEFKTILEDIYEHQMEGKFKTREEALDYIRQKYIH